MQLNTFSPCRHMYCSCMRRAPLVRTGMHPLLHAVILTSKAIASKTGGTMLRTRARAAAAPCIRKHAIVGEFSPVNICTRIHGQQTGAHAAASTIAMVTIHLYRYPQLAPGPPSTGSERSSNHRGWQLSL